MPTPVIRISTSWRGCARSSAANGATSASVALTMRMFTRGTRASALGVLPLFVPGHLDCLELRFVRGFRVVVEPVELENLLPQVGKSDGQRIDLWEFLGQGNPDVFGVEPLHERTSASFSSSGGAGWPS